MEGSICCIGFIPTKRRPKVNRFGGNFEQKNKKEEALIKKAYIEQGGEKYTGAIGLSLTIVKPLPKNTPMQ